MSASIDPVAAHFVWFGEEFPWVHWLALRSAASRGGFARVEVHHADGIAGPVWEAAQAIPGVSAHRLDAEALLAETGPSGPALVEIYRRLVAPAARANMVRAALLFREGGVYLDFDTVTVRPVAPLLADASVFCGVEHLAFPDDPRRRFDPGRFAAAWARTAGRDIFRRLPNGWRWFRRIEALYPVAPNNAVLGARAGHPFVGDLLERMVRLPRSRQLVRFALGTHLLEHAVAEYRGDDLCVHPPETFYPLGPEISEHWFRPSSAPLDELIPEATLVVHWYASVRTRRVVPLLTPDWVAAHRGREPFSTLAAAVLADR
ncbi:MAG: hypothetical protein JW751_26695 [Polyangiaceae bacterium]|nr:hypothetical protein [Polyangiaceae bacterium]